ncbi:hypothetical protein JYU20_00720 [Bacteroidales bacterium AH-315-I05]|nr:hypothetical protein [Bacteroidales bacterium AH-315-I05]
MIVKMIMYGCRCDNCGKQWYDEETGYVAYTDKAGVNDELEDGGWHRAAQEVGNDKHYCEECWEWNENDDLVVKERKGNNAP